VLWVGSVVLFENVELSAVELASAVELFPGRLLLLFVELSEELLKISGVVMFPEVD